MGNAEGVRKGGSGWFMVARGGGPSLLSSRPLTYIGCRCGPLTWQSWPEPNLDLKPRFGNACLDCEWRAIIVHHHHYHYHKRASSCVVIIIIINSSSPPSSSKGVIMHHHHHHQRGSSSSSKGVINSSCIHGAMYQNAHQLCCAPSYRLLVIWGLTLERLV